LVSALPKSCPVGFADFVPKFSFESITASIHIKSPVHDGFYAWSFVSLNISMAFYTHAPALDSGEIPYQEVSCIYSLDDCECKDVPLTSVRHQEFADLPNGGYWVKAFCIYGGDVSGLSGGQHFISLSVKPDEILAYDTLQFFILFHRRPRATL